MNRFSVFFILFFLGLSAAWAGDSGQVIRICGSGDNQELLRRLARAHEASHPGLRIEVPDSIGSSGGVKAVARGQCDLGRLARPLRAKEQEPGLTYRSFARSPVVFLVSVNLRDLDTITAQQVVRIFAGKMTSWQDMGGPAGPIYVANREKGDSSRTVLEHQMIDFALIGKPQGQTIYSTPETVAIVAGHDNTIAYAPLAAAIKEPRVHILAFEGVRPSAEALATGHYPLAVDFGLVWRGDLSAAARAFVAFLDTAEAAAIITGHGALPVPGGKL